MSSYELRIPKTCGDVIPLAYVADAMARAAATTYGRIQLHKPSYDGHLPGYIAALLSEARAGRLVVCNQFGATGTVDEVIEAAKNSGNLIEASRYKTEPDWERLHIENPPVANGVWNLTQLDLGPEEIDWDKTHIGCLSATLHHLNQWGQTKGDVFFVSDEWFDWVDERGIVADPHCPRAPAARNDAAVHDDTASNAVIPGKLPNIAIGKLAIKAAWQIECESKRAASVKDVMNCLQKWADDGIEAGVLVKSRKEVRGVEWMTQKGVLKIYDVDTCGKTLKAWRKTAQ